MKKTYIAPECVACTVTAAQDILYPSEEAELNFEDLLDPTAELRGPSRYDRSRYSY